MELSASKHVSPWADTMAARDYRAVSLPEGQVDVLVIGAGITGLTTALLLQREGRRVSVIEGRRMAESVTTHSTVKVTVGHGTHYTQIAQSRGDAAAQVYAEANLAGFEQILHLATSMDIDCALEHGPPHVVYAEHAERLPQIDQEARLAQRLGLPVTLTDSAPLPFGVAGAVSFAQQATLHPGRYLTGLAEVFVRQGGTLVEGVWARAVNDTHNGCEIHTTAGRIRARHVVVATHYPFLNRGGQFTRLMARRSYGIAGVLPPGSTAGMTINVESPVRSTRTARLQDEELLIVVGEGHDVGHVSDTAQRWENLRGWARQRFGVGDFRYHWSAQEVSSIDHLPYVGYLWPGTRRILTATAFDGWGMTNASAAAMLMRDLVVGRANTWEPTFDARRAMTRTPPVKEYVGHNVHVAKTWLHDRLLGSPSGRPENLRPGSAAITEVDGKETAAYRDEQGNLHTVSAACTHMKCTVEWNGGEKSWDCPCHGSRFGVDGEVLHGPASTPLPRTAGAS